MLRSSRFRARALTSTLFTLAAIVLAAEAGTGCDVYNSVPPEVQISRQAVADLPCDGAVYITDIDDIFSGSDPEYCAYGCGRSQRYLCSDTTGDCRKTWPDVCP